DKIKLAKGRVSIGDSSTSSLESIDSSLASTASTITSVDIMSTDYRVPHRGNHKSSLATGIGVGSKFGRRKRHSDEHSCASQRTLWPAGRPAFAWRLTDKSMSAEVVPNSNVRYVGSSQQVPGSIHFASTNSVRGFFVGLLVLAATFIVLLLHNSALTFITHTLIQIIAALIALVGLAVSRVSSIGRLLRFWPTRATHCRVDHESINNPTNNNNLIQIDACIIKQFERAVARAT
ncbi:hypothetical protein GZH46_00235, partial [Fragariocoptes setiger]